MHKKARKLIRTYFQMYRLWKTLGSKNRYCSPSLYASINLIECDIGRSTRILCLLPKFSRLCTLRYKHKLPSTVRISPRTIRCKYTKVLELKRFLNDFKRFLAKQSFLLDCFVPRSDAKQQQSPVGAIDNKQVVERSGTPAYKSVW